MAGATTGSPNTGPHSATERVEVSRRRPPPYRRDSHWDNQGYKPYMRYTLLGGTGSISEKLAVNRCSAPPPDQTRAIPAPCALETIENAINASEWGMMNNDTKCCNDGHRENILEPIHNHVSLGVAYNSTAVYLVEDFEDSYIGSGSLQLSGSLVTLSGSTQQGLTGWTGGASGAAGAAPSGSAGGTPAGARAPSSSRMNQMLTRSGATRTPL